MKSNLLEIKKSIEISAKECRRNPQEIHLVAVSKKQSLEKIQDCYNLGQRIFAENYIQEFLEKKSRASADIQWHLIGDLQKNKINKVIGQFQYIHSIQDFATAQILGRKSEERGFVQKILLQVNLANEMSKGGTAEEGIGELARSIATLSGIQLCGLMSMPPLAKKAEDSRKYFRRLKELQKELQKVIPTMRELSMGTTQDYVVAIQEGATFVRIGEALFGSREH